MPDRQYLEALAASVERGRGISNAVDIAVEVALFEPDEEWASIRVNAAGTKTICTSPDGREKTFWARDYTISAANRKQAAAALRAKAEANHA